MQPLQEGCLVTQGRPHIEHKIQIQDGAHPGVNLTWRGLERHKGSSASEAGGEVEASMGNAPRLNSRRRGK